MPATTRDVLENLFHAAVAAADPATLVEHALAATSPSPGGRLYVLGIGKGSWAMTRAAAGWSEQAGKPVRGGLVVSDVAVEEDHKILRCMVGDHPLPGPRSYRAAEAVEQFSLELRTEDEVWVLLSGGTSSLIGAPAPGIDPRDYEQLCRMLFHSGLNIQAVNVVRKRVSRWGAGRLALALSPARVRVLAISDVAGDDVAALGSGPCAPDPTSASEVKTLLQTSSLWSQLPASIVRYVDEVIAGLRGETPKFDDPRFSRVHTKVIANTETALRGVASQARKIGLDCYTMGALEGDACATGAGIADQLLEAARRGKTGVFLWGGETTVTLEDEPPDDGPRRGGRCQELALSAALRLARFPEGRQVTLLAAGTDGRDGPTDAAGAIVDGTTTVRIQDAEQDLVRHDAYHALDQAGALLRTGPTGTNVRDIVIGRVTA